MADCSNERNNMRTTNPDITNETIAVDIKGLIEILSCSEPTTLKIGPKAQVRIPISGKRVLYSVNKGKTYLHSCSY